MVPPAFSEAAPSAPLASAHPPLARPQSAIPAPVAERRAVAPARPLRPALPARNPAWEILAAALLLVAWAMLWSFFLDAVVEPGAALQRGARTSAAEARSIAR